MKYINAIIAVCFLFICLSTVVGQQRTRHPFKIGDKFPKFSVEDLSENEFGSQDFQGKVSVLYFFTSPLNRNEDRVKREVEQLNTIVTNFQERDDIQFYAITPSSYYEGEDYRDVLGLKYRIAADSRYKISELGINSYPLKIILNREGEIVYIRSGSNLTFPVADDMINAINPLFGLKSKPLQTAKQQADPDFKPKIVSPMYPNKNGTEVFIDEGHYNFHTKEGKYKGFVNLLEQDGYRLQPMSEKITKEKLLNKKIIVISNALNASNEKSWKRPILSAFTLKEISVLDKWVKEGGSLFLIADHMPFAGAATDLAMKFGFGFTDGFVFSKTEKGPIKFTRKSKELADNMLTNGRDKKEQVNFVMTFTGQAFSYPTKATAILKFGDNYVNKIPKERAWKFDGGREYNPKGMAQLAYKNHEKGKIVVSGEAAMFAAQQIGVNGKKFGMNDPAASDNYKLLLNIIHWLDNKL